MKKDRINDTLKSLENCGVLVARTGSVCQKVTAYSDPSLHCRGDGMGRIELARAVGKAADLALVSAVSRATYAGRTVGEVLDEPTLTTPIFASVASVCSCRAMWSSYTPGRTARRRTS